MTTEIEVAVNSLNRAFKQDPDAIKAIFSRRVPCNKALAGHPFVQVTENQMVGVIGILNGVIEPITGERIALILSDKGELKGFTKFKP